MAKRRPLTPRYHDNCARKSRALAPILHRCGPAICSRTQRPSGDLAMPSAPVIPSLDSRGVATVTLNRPEVGNAYNGDLIQGLLDAMDALSARARLRVVLLRGGGQRL